MLTTQLGSLSQIWLRIYMYVYPSSPLGYKWFSGSPCEINLINPSLYKLPGPPIRQIWITRGRTFFPPTYKTPSETLQKRKAVEPDSLVFLFYHRLTGNVKTTFSYFNLFNYVFCLASPPIAPVAQSNLIYGHRRKQDNQETRKPSPGS